MASQVQSKRPKRRRIQKTSSQTYFLLSIVGYNHILIAEPFSSRSVISAPVLMKPTRSNNFPSNSKSRLNQSDFVDDYDFEHKDATVSRETKSLRENFSGLKDPITNEQTSNLLTPYSQVDLPPWLSRYYSSNKVSLSEIAVGNDTWKHFSRKKQVEEKIKNFEFLLLEKYCWLTTDVKDVVETIYATSALTTASVSSLSISSQESFRSGMIHGMLDFLNLVVDSISFDTNSTVMAKPTKEVLLATILHYAECIAAQQDGVPQMVKSALFQRPGKRRNKYILEPTQSSAFKSDKFTGNRRGNHRYPEAIKHSTDSDVVDAGLDVQIISTPTDSIEIISTIQAEDALRRAQPVIPINPHDNSQEGDEAGHSNGNDEGLLQNVNKDGTPEYEVWSIVKGAARLKRAEILVQALSESNAKPAAIDADEALRVRGLLMTIGADWRSLAMRCVACLFRLDGILEAITKNSDEYQIIPQLRSPEILRKAREGIRVYATLAEQLGLHRLKAQIEDRAFRILYRRQYGAVMSLYNSFNYDLETVSTFLKSQIYQILSQDESLVSHIEELHVKARVKDPYSFWRKLLKSKANSSNSRLISQIETDVHNKLSLESNMIPRRIARNSVLGRMSTLSVTDVHDTVAVRVILKSKKLVPSESDAVTRARDELLCYYVQQLIVRSWPDVDTARMKDYIKNPKKNGYRSLHFTAMNKIIENEGECDLPFEVQIRSVAMHEIAEYGVASHWGYKLGHSVAPGENDDNLSKFLSKDTPVPSLRRLLPGQGKSDIIDSSKDKQLSSGNDRDSYVAALDLARRDILRQKVYVFIASTSEEETVESEMVKRSETGYLLSLPINTRIRDALDELNEICVDLNITSNNPHVVHNGRTATLDDIVKNGDILMIHFS